VLGDFWEDLLHGALDEDASDHAEGLAGGLEGGEGLDH